MQTKETKRCQSERKNCLPKCFHLFKYVLDHEKVHSFFLDLLWTCCKEVIKETFFLLPCSKSLNDINSFHYFKCPSVLLAAFFQLRSFCSSHMFIAIQILFMNIYKFFKKSSTRNKNNLEINLRRNLRTDRARECIFRASECKNFEDFPSRCQPWWHLCGFDVCNGLPKKLCIPHCYLSQRFQKEQLELVE